jgi:toxin ParE1/3/4
MPERYEVRLALAAERDLEQLRGYLLDAAGPRQTREILSKLREAFVTLGSYPERGACPRELESIAADYRQLVVHPYRIVYRIEDRRVLIFMVADGRRDMRSLLTKRLLSS